MPLRARSASQDDRSLRSPRRKIAGRIVGLQPCSVIWRCPGQRVVICGSDRVVEYALAVMIPPNMSISPWVFEQVPSV